MHHEGFEQAGAEFSPVSGNEGGFQGGLGDSAVPQRLKGGGLAHRLLRQPLAICH